MGWRVRLKQRLDRVQGATSAARLVLWTFRVCLRYRVTGLAAEAAYFMVLSLPPLVLAVFAGAGYLGNLLGRNTVERFTHAITEYASNILTADAVADVIVPTVHGVFSKGRLDLLSVGFVLALWSGSRALNVMLDTVSIMYGHGGVRGIVRTRALSFSLYVGGVFVTAVALPMLLVGPNLIRRWLSPEMAWLRDLYWPVVGLLGAATIAGLYHIATPERLSWRRELPGGFFTIVVWVLSSVVLRAVIDASVGGTSIYGPLATPIVILIWLYALAIALLIGAGVNAAARIVWPPGGGTGAEPDGPQVPDPTEQQYLHAD